MNDIHGVKPELKQISAEIKISFPDNLWISDIFKKYSDLTMEITSFLPYVLESSIGNLIAEILHQDIDGVIEAIKNHKTVFEFNIFERKEKKIKFNIKIRNAYLLDALIHYGILVNFPIRVRDGQVYWKFIANRNAIDNLLTFFELKKIEFTILKIGISPYDIDKINDRLSLDESNILEMAIDLGFFEIPRNISLENLSKKLGRSKSAISVTLRKIIKKKVVI